MGSESDLKTWVSDKLMSLLGYSQPAVVQYVIGITKQAKSPAELVEKLLDSGWTSSSDMRNFPAEIFFKVPHKSAGPNDYQRHEKEAAMLVRKQKTYALLDADHDEEEDVKPAALPVVSESGKSDSHKKRYRKKALSQEDEDDEVIEHKEDVGRVKRRTSSDEDDGSESDEERLRDQRE